MQTRDSKAQPDKPRPDKRKKSITKQKRPEVSTEQIILTRFTNYLQKEDEDRLRGLAKSLVEPGKGILAVDDSVDTIDNCLRSMKLSGTETNRVRYMDVLVGSCKELCHFVSGVLVRDEMSKLKFYRGRSLFYLLNSVGIHLGIRADTSFTKLPGTDGEFATQGLDGLDQDCKKWRDRGASFTLWRCVYKVTCFTPSQLALLENSYTLAKFASFSQTAGLVPVLSVELLPDGDYDLKHAQGSLRDVLAALVKALHDHNVYLEGVIIRLTPTFPGAAYTNKYSLNDVVQSTILICNGCIPTAVAGIMVPRRDTLLQSVEIVNELNKAYMKKPATISYCFSRVISHDVIKIWAGHDTNLEKAQTTLVRKAETCSQASMGQYPESNGSLFISRIRSDYKPRPGPESG